ncbi:MAG TPA: hypothetical protein VHF50_02325 [Solirubrobacterales bacterium]|nr:hypothetical protein [Solirubrobacterales bacterium]
MPEELPAELTRQEQEILRLRDLLIAKDAELGAAKGRLAEIEERAARLTNIATRIERRLPGFGKLLGTAVRMLRSQRP